MTEMAKTLSFVTLAVVSLVAAFMAGPSVDDFDIQAEVGKRLNQFDVEDAKRLRIVTFDKETASTHEFEVAEEEGLWTIPSKQGYPADAVRQMGAAATCLIDREVLRIAAENASQHAELGLVDPTASNLDIETVGVGIRVTLTDIDGAPLADMIIGKQVPETLDQYYVRNANQDVAYVVNLQPDALTTRFDDWIEKDLLKLNPFDIRRVHIKDYSAELVFTLQGIRVNWDRRGEIELRYDNTKSQWIAERLQTFDPDKTDLVDYTLGEDETLNEDALRELRNGLDDLVIVDVERKPAGLSADLKAGSDFVKNEEAAASLVTRGFAPVPAGEGNDLDILSSEGEVICTLEDGIEYVLRFGNLQMESDTGALESEGSAAEGDSDDGIHRYLFVMARFNGAMIEKPELTELPDLPDLPEGPAGAEESAETDAAAEEDDDPEESTADQAPKDSEETEETAEESAEDADAAAEEDAQAEGEANGNESDQSELSKLIAERKAIENENQRLLEEYQQKLDSAQERVQELNERFGDWYYVIDNRVYQHIHLSRDDVIKSTQAAEAESDSDDAPGTGLPGLPNLPLSQ
ncbi:MAG: DUF4340 domain-containing protein [Planctomycetes bacterium]|nr:DUF4340 domain-containing protein [Planctomycetota bacterium]